MSLKHQKLSTYCYQQSQRTTLCLKTCFICTVVIKNIHFSTYIPMLWTGSFLSGLMRGREEGAGQKRKRYSGAWAGVMVLWSGEEGEGTGYTYDWLVWDTGQVMVLGEVNEVSLNHVSDKNPWIGGHMKGWDVNFFDEMDQTSGVCSELSTLLPCLPLFSLLTLFEEAVIYNCLKFTNTRWWEW